MARVQQTAMPTRVMFSEVPFEIWDNIFEFTYLSPEAMQGTTLDQRGEDRDAYWHDPRPGYSTGKGAESFSECVRSVRDCLNMMKSLPDNAPVVIFGHEQFFQVIRLLASFPKASDLELMKMLRDVTGKTPEGEKKAIEPSRIRHGQIIKAVINDRGIILQEADKVKAIGLNKQL